jgi:hypothetical protein
MFSINEYYIGSLYTTYVDDINKNPLLFGDAYRQNNYAIDWTRLHITLA